MPEAFHKGWQYYIKATTTGMTVKAGMDYCVNVEQSIEQFAEDMYKMVQEHGNLGVGQCKGFVAEVWHADTFNIDAALKGSVHKAFVDKSNSLGSVDVSTNFGSDYSMKYLGSAKASANAQAKNYYDNYYEYLRRPRKGEPVSFEEYLQKYGIENNPEDLLKSVYSNQYRVIPTEQLKDAIKHLETLKKIEEGKNCMNRALVYQNYIETLEKLRDRIKDGEGVESIPLDKETAEIIVELCREGKFNPEDFGIDIVELITTDYILQQALKAGYTAAVMSLVMEIAPKVCEAIILLVKNGEIDSKQLKELGLAAARGPAIGFIRGYVSCALTVACNSGKLGPQFVGVQGNVIAAITVLVMDTVKNAIFVATGKITVREMSVKTEDAAIISIGALIGGSIGTTLLPQLAVLGYMVGSFVGSVVGTIVAESKNAIIVALCANTGITLFGLVDQDYMLSKEIIESLGLSVVSLNHVELARTGLKRNELKRIELKKNELKYLDIVCLRRGVIGIRRIGYVK